jgi:hypothetical protein
MLGITETTDSRSPSWEELLTLGALAYLNTSKRLNVDICIMESGNNQTANRFYLVDELKKKRNRSASSQANIAWWAGVGLFATT